MHIRALPVMTISLRLPSACSTTTVCGWERGYLPHSRPSTVMRISLSPVEDWDLGISAATASSTATSASMPAMIAIFRFPVVRSASFPRKRTALFRKEAP